MTQETMQVRVCAYIIPREDPSKLVLQMKLESNMLTLPGVEVEKEETDIYDQTLRRLLRQKFGGTLGEEKEDGHPHFVLAHHTPLLRETDIRGRYIDKDVLPELCQRQLVFTFAVFEITGLSLISRDKRFAFVERSRKGGSAEPVSPLMRSVLRRIPQRWKGLDLPKMERPFHANQKAINEMLVHEQDHFGLPVETVLRLSRPTLRLVTLAA